MSISLAAALEREHREIDQGISRLGDGSALTAGDVTAALRAAKALRRHIYLEETILFPALYDDRLVGPLLTMLREHARIWAMLDALEQDLNVADAKAVTPGLVRRLTVQLQHHNATEERSLYPAADATLTPEAATRLRVFLDRGDLPAGWVCLKAR